MYSRIPYLNNSLSFWAIHRSDLRCLLYYIEACAGTSPSAPLHLAFFKDRWAARWSENLFYQETDTSIFSIQSWANFKQQFQSQFFLVNVEANAVNALEGSSYYQGN